MPMEERTLGLGEAFVTERATKVIDNESGNTDQS